MFLAMTIIFFTDNISHHDDPFASTTARVRGTKEWHVLHIAALAPLPVPPFYGPGLYQVRTLYVLRQVGGSPCVTLGTDQHTKSHAWVTFIVVVIRASFRLIMFLVVYSL